MDAPRLEFRAVPAYPVRAMPMPVLLALGYLVVNLAFTIWLERERAQGRRPARLVTTLAWTLRYGPPLLGAAYLVAIAGDWLFVGFVIVFFAAAFWLMNGLLAYTNHSDGVARIHDEQNDPDRS
jgi:hypothetical protein